MMIKERNKKNRFGVTDWLAAKQKKGIKKIVVDGSDGSSPRASTFEEGVFTLKHKFDTNVDNGDERVKEWTKMIESKL